MGRPSKGLRARISIRMPHTLHRQVQQESERLGMNLNDWVIWALKNSMRSSKRRVTPREQELEAS